MRLEKQCPGAVCKTWKITLLMALLKITLELSHIPISTTSGQQKGSLSISRLPNRFLYLILRHLRSTGSQILCYLPHYTADIAGEFEMQDRPIIKANFTSGRGQRTQAGTWMDALHYPGDRNWKIMKSALMFMLITMVGRNYGTYYRYRFRLWLQAKRIYLNMSAEGTVHYTSQTGRKEYEMALFLQQEKHPYRCKPVAQSKLRFSGSSITGFVDKIQILTSSTLPFQKEWQDL